jgi:hypothetical protein
MPFLLLNEKIEIIFRFFISIISIIMNANRTCFRKLTSNSQTTVSQMNQVRHPTVGMLRLKRCPHVYCHMDKCSTLQNTAIVLSELYDVKDNHKYMESWRYDVFRKLLDFVYRYMPLTLDDIDSMMLVSRILLDNDKKYYFQEFILRCPKKFIIIYSNNPLCTPAVLHKLDRTGLNNIRSYLIEHIQDSFY